MPKLICKCLWDKKREPIWSLDFIKKMRIVVDSKEKAIKS